MNHRRIVFGRRRWDAYEKSISCRSRKIGGKAEHGERGRFCKKHTTSIETNQLYFTHEKKYHRACTILEMVLFHVGDANPPPLCYVMLEECKVCMTSRMNVFSHLVIKTLGFPNSHAFQACAASPTLSSSSSIQL